MSSDDRFDMEALSGDALDCVRAERSAGTRGDDVSPKMRQDVLARLEQSIASGAKPTFRDSAPSHGLMVVVPVLLLLGAGVYGASRWQAPERQGQGSPAAPPAAEVALTPTVVTTLAAPPPQESLPPELPTVDIHALPDGPSVESAASERHATSAATRPLAGSPRASANSVNAANGANGAPAPPSSTLVDEYAILNRANQLLSQRDFAAASAALDEHGRRFPQGQLVEERERLRVNLLVDSGRLDEARARAREFRQRFPRGFLLPAVEDSLGGSP